MTPINHNIKPIYYYEHPFALPRGGVDKTGWVWRGDKCFCHHSSVVDLFASDEVDREFTLFTEAADMMYHYNDEDSIGVGFPHLPNLYTIQCLTIPKGLKKWYTTNSNLDKGIKSQLRLNIECCPIGIYDGYHNNKIPKREIESLMKEVDKVDKKTLCLMNFNINNRMERHWLYHSGKQVEWVSTYENKDFDYKQILSDILHSKFVICPISNGIETSRIWESVLLGAIPVVIQSPWSDNFKDLPILSIPSWNCLTKSFLEDTWQAHICKLNSNQYNYNKLDANYWTRLTESV